ncbi:Co2+/Mg2+ efflux protein ApaG [Motiliproteus sp. MSK22-1]|uniref:Co2+/Mg2+ efflux protein ApaG n=1 Tax=Motiliproteus sp. MSK22-1 TaxID=1897630 RepID=UPI000976A99A|nr:Co2+/Mg2+ efflux protein ApaG [Motiliproteus sp. MSK22-1]OMH32155.1 Co2+/Mg2+ efflux protein ApaG [Motiliproteus sp. MSK22-1]
MGLIQSHPVNIDVETQYLDEQSDPDNKRYVFSYLITITNNDTESVQLLSRYWQITDGDQQIQEVEGQGVIGEQPTISPGESYTYTSGTVIATEVGSMTGHYRMRTASGDHFEAPIQAFTLALPNALH